MTAVTVVSLAADVLVVLGIVVMTIGVIGMFRMPDIYTQLHAASKAVFLGVVAIAGASAASLDPGIISRAALIAVCLCLTTPVAAHVIAKAARMAEDRDVDRRGEQSSSPER
jgi:multicomponent Na+:H+ antiporter subunit G